MSNNPFNAPTDGDSVNPDYAKGKVVPVGIALIIAGVLSFLASGYWVVNGAVVMTQGDEVISQMSDTDREKLAESGIDMQTMIGGMGIVFLIGGILGAVCSLVVIWGGICAMRLKGRKMAMASAILSIIPIFQSCCIVSMPIGIWALVVLMAPDVKAAFK